MPTLPDLIDPWRAADSNSVLVGRLPLSGLPRLRAALTDESGDVAYRIAFSRDHGGRTVLLGKVEARPHLRCQRCLQDFEHPIVAEMALAVVSGLDEARLLPDRYDPLLVTDNLIRPVDLIEDELLLGLPQIPRHEAGSCAPARTSASDLADRNGKVADNPFAALAGLKRKRQD
jgi:uncharacterized protein